MKLENILNAWGQADFKQRLKAEIENMSVAQLPLQQGLSSSSIALDDSLNAVILAVDETTKCIRIKAGIFYTGMIAGCSCADDPTPAAEQSEYCEVQLDINRLTAETTIVLLSD